MTIRSATTLVAAALLGLHAQASDLVCRYVFSGQGMAKESAGRHPDMTLSRGKPEPGHALGGVRLDAAALSTTAVVLSNAFTVCAWIRPLGFGSKAVGRDWPNGMVVNSGSGYYDGWRLVIQEPARFRPVFEIGRTNGSVAVVAGAGLSTSIWHHVAASWSPDGDRGRGTMRLYVDGRLEAESGADVAPPLPPNAPLSIGYTDFGVGSMHMDFAELAVYDRALDAPEIARQFLSGTYEQNLAPPDARAKLLGHRALLLESGDADAARRLWRQIADDESCGIVPRILAAEQAGDAPAATNLASRSDAPDIFKMRYGVDGFSDEACSLADTPPLPLPDRRLHVATTGDDAGTGGADAPFATLERARDEIRKLRADGFADAVAVMIAPGRYARTASFALDRRDGGSETGRVVYAAASGGDDIVFDGGNRIAGSRFQPVADPAILSRLPEAGRGRVRVADVPEHPAGQTSFGVGENGRAVLMLLADDAALLHPARWPNTGFITETNVLGETASAIPLAAGRAPRWLGAEAPMAHGYWRYDWADAALPVAIEKTDAGLSLTLRKSHCYGLAERPRFYVFNLLEELDEPGEWHYDAATAKLYLIPPEGKAPQPFTLTTLDAPLVAIDGADHVEFRGIAFRHTRGDAVKVRQARQVAFGGCDFRGIGGAAIVADGCPGFVVRDSSFRNLGHGALDVSAGDRRTLEPGGIRIHGNAFSRVGQFARTYTPAVLIHGVGAVVCHNECRDMPSSAMRLEGNDHVVERNDIHDVVLESDDQGAIDLWGDPSYRRCVFRHNTFKDVGGAGATDCGRGGIRFDDAISGMIVYGNTFINSARGNFGGVQIHGGNNNVVYANRFIDCGIGVSFSPWGRERWLERIERNPEYVEKIRQRVDVFAPPHSTRYPELARLREDFDRNFIWGNTMIRCAQPLANPPIQVESLWNR